MANRRNEGYGSPRHRSARSRYGERYDRDYDDACQDVYGILYTRGHDNYSYSKREIGNIDYDYEMRYGRSGIERRATPGRANEGEGYVPYPPGTPGNMHSPYFRRARRMRQPR